VSTGSGEHLETERKYDAGPGFTLPDLSGLPGVAAVSPARTYQLSAVYFDTGSARLAAARITLRRRTGGQDEGWHLKLPAGGDTRREIRLPLGAPGTPVPADLTQRVDPWAHGEPLRPVARLETTREVRLLTSETGQVLAEVADDQVSGARAARTGADGSGQQPAWLAPLRWREIEVELAGGTGALLAAAGQRLIEAGAAPASAASKLARVLAAAPADPGAGPPGPG
jgi:inorganic triphosphatase YgiF